MPTYFIEVDQTLAPDHRTFLRNVHRRGGSKNNLSVIPNRLRSRFLIKLTINTPIQANDLPVGFVSQAIHTIEEARSLLQTVEWQHPTGIG